MGLFGDWTWYLPRRLHCSRNFDVDGNIDIVNPDGTGLTQVTHIGGSQVPDWGIHPLAR